jgi:DNA-binding NtrC family response regulator
MITAMLERDTGVSVPITRHNVNALILDDDQFDRLRIRRLFRNAEIPFYLDEADTLETFEAILDREDYDIIFVDYKLAKSDGIQALKIVQSHPRNSKAATIMITGDDQSDVAVRAMKSGCVDYLSKNKLTVDLLKRSVTSAIDHAKLVHLENTHRVKALDDVANSIVAKYSIELRPEIARIIRDIRALKMTMSNPNSNLPADLEAIEKRCIGLWTLLNEPSEKLH